MTPTLRKLYHRRGKLLSHLNEIDRQIEGEMLNIPEADDLIVYDDGEDFYIAIVYMDSILYDNQGWFIGVDINHLTILEKGFDL